MLFIRLIFFQNAIKIVQRYNFFLKHANIFNFLLQNSHLCYALQQFVKNFADDRMREDHLLELRNGVTPSHGKGGCGYKLRAGITDHMHT